ncbi:MAG: SDR family NAD(P)-dependent oxidoreductase [Bacteroidetes bacterium]|nr:MAG: SDR family NAD(P)-dependent oxidoreductase [Bacteroidota bacterium]
MNSDTKKILISGASSGIGRALAIEYGRRGADVILLARNEEQLNVTKQMLERKGGRGFVKVCDVTGWEYMNSAVEFAVNTLGGIDIAILNAGISGSQNIDGMDIEKFRQLFEVNFFGIVNGFNTILPIMKKQGNGKIVGIGSLADFRGVPGVSAYNSSKAALSNFLESARIELKQFGIQVITVKPGFVKSSITEKNEFYMPMLMEADKAAIIIVDGIEKNKSSIKFPMPIVFSTFLGKIAPAPIFDCLVKRYRIRKKQ